MNRSSPSVVRKAHDLYTLEQRQTSNIGYHMTSICFFHQELKYFSITLNVQTFKLAVHLARKKYRIPTHVQIWTSCWFLHLNKENGSSDLSNICSPRKFGPSPRFAFAITSWTRNRYSKAIQKRLGSLYNMKCLTINIFMHPTGMQDFVHKPNINFEMQILTLHPILLTLDS